MRTMPASWPFSAADSVPMKPSLFAIGWLVCAALMGCATPPKPYEAPQDTPLQDPLPGRAVVYLLRAPYDDLRLEVILSGIRVAVLPPEAYTAIDAAPGIHEIRTRFASRSGAGEEIAPPFQLQLQANERRFLNVSGVTAKTVGVSGFLSLPKGVPVPMPVPMTGTASGTHSWKEVTELDAQGLMSISRFVWPAR